SIFLVLSGYESAHEVALHQPTKLAAMEGVYDGKSREGIIAVGVLNPEKEIGDANKEFLFKIEIPQMLSFLGFHDFNAFVPGINDLVYGNEKMKIESAATKIEKGKKAIAALKAYKEAKKRGEQEAASSALETFKRYEKYFGYGYLEDPKEIIPPVALNFYSFHMMVGLGTWFMLLFFLVLYYAMIGQIERKKMLLRAALFSIPLGYLAAELGWIVAESGRQPWAIQGMLPVGMASSQISVAAVQTTFWLFAVVFTVLLIAEIGIMTKQIKIGMEGH
ncbi:MAG TPA: cytochrome ubiquinol oxidase subunit I, partial [Campylobacteraceae bacterium]|nr:cytochrome ubiquinol oxidase subunit I [Campylobacteraceae bacterium]